ncbi:hypothetical protein BDR05DRAFT_490601 [Suillus weaverae]|nr:hypothetical protein BDR05DRAFT_490601 [Suillus weaverae]
MYITDSEVQQMLFGLYAILAGNSILIYDHMVTLPEEIAFIWRRPKALSAMLFLLNRYVALLANISSLVVDFVPLSDELFEIYVIQTTGPLPPGNNCFHKRLLIWIVIVMLALAGVCCAGTFGRYSGDVNIIPGVGCNETFSKRVYPICKTRGFLRLSLVARRNIIDIIFHDGTMFFGAMTLSNIPNILTYYSGSVGIRGSLCTFTSCISVTLISRLMLNLHQTIDTGILSIPAQDDGPSLAVLTTRVDIQSAFSSHH